MAVASTGPATTGRMQHDCEPLPNGNITLFANGINTTTNPFSRAIELDPRTGKIVWEYRAKPSYTFFSPHVSGTQRLRTGNMLICEGQWGRLSETDCQVTINPPSERPTSLLGNRSFRMARNTVSGAALAPVVTIRPHLRTEILKRSEVASRGSRFCRDDRS